MSETAVHLLFLFFLFNSWPQSFSNYSQVIEYFILILINIWPAVSIGINEYHSA